MERKQAGFTLVEILIVVAIIGILASVAIPALMRSRLNANESATKANLKSFSTGIESYRSAQALPTYPADIGDMTNATPAYLDTTWGAGTTATRNSYDYTYVFTDANRFAAFAEPTDPGITGNNSYCVDETGIVWVSSTSTGAFSTSPCSDGLGATTIA